jgi:hypothetical protein
MKSKPSVKTSYSVSINVSKPSSEIFSQLVNLSNWWPEEFVGEPIGPNSVFELKTGEEHYSENRVVEFAECSKLIWITTSSKRSTDNFDWSGTKMIFELLPNESKTLIRITYDGEVLENEQDRLAAICDFCIKDLLYNYLESFSTKIEVEKSPGEVFKVITYDVSKWWGGKDLKGSTTSLGDEFTIIHSRRSLFKTEVARANSFQEARLAGHGQQT